MNSWDKCKNCGGYYALHHYETNQCPRKGVEAPLNRKQVWMTTTFELVDTQDAELAKLRANNALMSAQIVKDTELMRQDEREQEALRAANAAQAQRIATLEAAVEKARELLTTLEWNDWDERVDTWLAAHPAMLHKKEAGSE